MSIANLISHINKHHNAEFQLINRLEGGYQDGAYLLVEPNGQQSVLKCRFADRAVDVVNQLHKVGYPVSALRYAGRTNDGPSYWIQDFVNGQPMKEITEDSLTQMFDLNDLQANLKSPKCAQADQSWSRYAHQVVFANESGWNSTIRTYSSEAERFIPILERIAYPFSSIQLPETDVVHGDFIPDNLLVQNGKIVGVIDVTYAGYGTRVIDLATLLRYSYLYGYSSPVRMRLEQRIKQISPPPMVIPSGLYIE
ncbi:MAG: phosphotransferase [Chloroflexota bacterium]